MKIIIQESVENRVGAARRDANKVEDQVDGHHALRALEHLRHLRHQAEQAAMWQSQMKYLLKQNKMQKRGNNHLKGSHVTKKMREIEKRMAFVFLCFANKLG